MNIHAWFHIFTIESNERPWTKCVLSRCTSIKEHDNTQLCVLLRDEFIYIRVYTFTLWQSESVNGIRDRVRANFSGKRIARQLCILIKAPSINGHPIRSVHCPRNLPYVREMHAKREQNNGNTLINILSRLCEMHFAW